MLGKGMHLPALECQRPSTTENFQWFQPSASILTCTLLSLFWHLLQQGSRFCFKFPPQKPMRDWCPWMAIPLTLSLALLLNFACLLIYFWQLSGKGCFDPQLRENWFGSGDPSHSCLDQSSQINSNITSFSVCVLLLTHIGDPLYKWLHLYISLY